MVYLINDRRNNINDTYVKFSDLQKQNVYENFMNDFNLYIKKVTGLRMETKFLPLKAR